ncbi:hypothetical protein RclHR1_16310003 [Rhizophagus clarus]|uniref:F-box domain-containing protein n=1 Tax=Rhizophagus clarus TaxID=94130 RepID=A0A2Z6QHE5_9GLOM|nr:hypothetical protein RclHR1_16310003 [Rhizophagus clarus]
MVSKLNNDCLQNIFEFFETDQSTLFKCILVSRSWFEILVPYLWENPFLIVHRKGAANSKKLLTTIITMFPFDKSTEDKLNSCKYYKVTYHSFEKSFCNYLSFIKIFKSVEFHGFIDKCSRVTPWKYRPFKKYVSNGVRLPSPSCVYDEGTISSILTHHICDIIFKNCTKIRQIALLNISSRLMDTCSFNNFSNICQLEIGKIIYLRKIFHDCKNIKKITINTCDGNFNNSDYLINFLRAQQGLKAIHLLNRSNCFEFNEFGQLKRFPKELLIQICSIEELGIKNFMLPYGQDYILSKLKRLEITFEKWPPRVVNTFQNVSCPLLEVLIFHDSLPPLDVLAEFIENTKGHLQCLHMKLVNREYYNTHLLLETITKSCPKIISLSTVINITEDLILLKNLLISCNELKNFTLVSINDMNQSFLQDQLRMINENWDVIHERCLIREAGTRPNMWTRFNKFHIKF